MKHSRRDITIALAGIFQAAVLVRQIANTGMANSAVIESSLETLFKFDSPTVDEVYGGLAGVATGLRVLSEQLSANRGNRDVEVTRYVLSMMVLEKKLSADSGMLQRIASTLEEIRSSLEYFSLMHENTALKLGQLYRDTVSQLQPRIIISGERPYLGNEHNASRVRALLLAGLRSAILWRQCGGTRWSILFGRRHYLNECEQMLRELK